MKKKRKYLQIYTIVTLVTGFHCYTSGFNLNKKEKTTAEKFRPLIEAIDKYVDQNNHYPLDLKKLIPKYLGQWPEGLPRFTYFIYNNDEDKNRVTVRSSYRIAFIKKAPGFGIANMRVINYSSIDKTWVVFEDLDGRSVYGLGDHFIEYY